MPVFKSFAMMAVAAAGLTLACMVMPSQPALADTGGYPDAGMPCELAPYNTVGYCDTVSGPYDWGPVKNGSAASQLSPYGYGYRNCTDYVAWKIHQVFGIALPKTLGNAATWGSRLSAAGYTFDSAPRVGDIAAWNTGDGGFGHVAYVFAVVNGIASLDEYNVAGTGQFTSNRTTASGSAGAPSEFVHIGNLPPISSATRNLLSNASWGSGSFAPWKTIAVNGGTVNWAAYKNSSLAEQGAWYGASNTSTAGGSIYQDVAVATSPGQSYTFSIWVRSASGSPVSGVLALWGLGGTQESDSTSFTAGSTWTQVAVPLDITKAGHTTLRAQLYESTPGQTYYFDGAALVNDGLSNASWGSGSFAPWKTIAVNGGTVNWAAYKNSSLAEQGAWYGASNTSTAGGSIYQDVAVATSPGQSYTFSIWVRSASGSPVSGVLALWGLGGTQESDSTSFTAGSTWTQVAVPLDITKAGHTTLRAQLYESTPGQTYYFDGAALVNDGLSNASWGSGSFAPWKTIAVNGGTVNWAAYKNSSLAEQGAWYGASNTSTAGGSIYQDVAVATSPGQSYTFSIWVRSASGSPVSGVLALWGLGGTQESDSTSFTAGSTWTQVAVPLDITKAGHTTLRAQLYESTPGQTYYFDGAAVS